jgi:hypothetical protein
MRSAARIARRAGDPSHRPLRAGRPARASDGGTTLATAAAAFARAATAARTRGQLRRAVHAREGCRVGIGGRCRLRGCRGDDVSPLRSSQPSSPALLRDVRTPAGSAESGSSTPRSDVRSAAAKGRQRGAPRPRRRRANHPSSGARPPSVDRSLADRSRARGRSRSPAYGRDASPLRTLPRGQRPGLAVLSLLRRIARGCSVDRCRPSRARTSVRAAPPRAGAAFIRSV